MRNYDPRERKKEKRKANKRGKRKMLEEKEIIRLKIFWTS